MAIPFDVPIRLDIDNIEFLRQVNPQIVRVVHERDHYTCRCCGFRSTKYQQILNPGGNWRNLDTVTTACIFCQQCFHLDSIERMRSGVLVTFPEISQADLNRLSVEIYVARTFQTSEVVRQASAGLELLMNTRETTRQQLGTDNPRELAGMLRACRSDAEHDVITKKLAGVRLFPLDRRILREADLEFNQFSQILRFWRSRSGPYPVDGTNALIRLKRFAETYL